jgi:hypothetical protein
MPANPRRFALNYPDIFIAAHIEGPGHEIIGNEVLTAFRQSGGDIQQTSITDLAMFRMEEDFNHAPGAGAMAWEQLRIPNGTFQFRAPTYGEIDIQIHTVQRGSLRGRRVVKVRDDQGPGGWRAIAFVSRAGNFQLWTRYLSLAEEPYTIAARAVVEAMRNTHGAGGGINVPSRSIASIPVVAQVSVTRRSCLICNDSMYSDQVTVNGGTRGMRTNYYCDNHLPAVTEVRRTIPSVDREEELARIRAENAAAAPAAPQRASQRRSEATYGDEHFVVRRRTALVMSDVNPEVIQ